MPPIGYIGCICEIILADRFDICHIVVAIPAAGLTDMGAMDFGAEGDHVLVDHAAEEGVTTCRKKKKKRERKVSYDRLNCMCMGGDGIDIPSS